VVAVGVEFPGEGGRGSWVGGGGGAPGGGDLEEAGRLELADGAVEGGGVAVLVGVEPAQREPAPADQVEVGVAPPLPQLGGVGQRLPHPLDRVRDPAGEADLEGAVGSLVGDPSAVGRSFAPVVLSDTACSQFVSPTVMAV